MKTVYQQPATDILPATFTNTLCAGSGGGTGSSGGDNLGGGGSGADPWSGGRVPVE